MPLTCGTSSGLHDGGIDAHATWEASQSVLNTHWPATQSTSVMAFVVQLLTKQLGMGQEGGVSARVCAFIMSLSLIGKWPRH